MNEFIKKLIYIISIVSVIIITANQVYLHLKYDYDNTDKFNDIPNAIDICNFGSSHGLYSYNYENLNDAYTCFNFALPSQSLDYDYRIMSQYQDRINENAIVFITVSYFSVFGEDEVVSEEQFQSKNNRYYKFLDAMYIKEYQPSKMILVNYFPIVISQNILINFITGTDFKNTKAERWKLTANSIDVNKDAREAYERHIVNHKFDANHNRVLNNIAIDSIEKMIDLCRERKAIPILVTTPYMTEYINTIKDNDPDFFDDFNRVIIDIVNRKNVQYYDCAFDKRFCNNADLFINSDHLNSEGATKFTKILYDEIVQPNLH